MSRVLVTGGTGFIGSHLVDALLSQGVEVRCLVRSEHRLRWLDGKNVELVEGDCARLHTLENAVIDVDVVYHVAGVTWASRESDYFLHNARGTRNLLEACREFCPNLARFVLVSSLAASGPAFDGRPRAESDPATPITPYGVSKLEAEHAAADYNEQFSVVILRLCAVYGPRDTGFLAYFRVVKRGFLVEFGRGDGRVVSLCHVSDVINGLIQAADSKVASGSVYFLADAEPYSWGEVETIIEDAMSVSAKRVRIPIWLLMLLGTLGQGYGRATGKLVKLNKARVAELVARHWGCDVSKARRELGFTPKMNLKDGMCDVVRWYKQEQWL